MKINHFPINSYFQQLINVGFDGMSSIVTLRRREKKTLQAVNHVNIIQGTKMETANGAKQL